MKRIVLVVFLFPLILSAQNPPFTLNYHASTINWTDGLSWEQLKAKAKSANKYIFIDAFATWCMPCKKMDKEVFTIDSVGDFFNEKFISVKVQMDKTKSDPDFIRSWYANAEEIKKEYWVRAFPTYIFLSPEGKITHKIRGYKSAPLLLKEAKLALKEGKVYQDPFEEYFKLLDAYNAGRKNYDKMPYMVESAKELREWDITRKIAKEYKTYLENQPIKKIYTKSNIKFLTQVTGSSRSTFFKLFLHKSRKVNRIMNVKNYAEYTVVDNVIQTEIVDSIFKKKSKDDFYSNKDWIELYNKVKSYYGNEYADRNLLMAKVKWADATKNYEGFVESYLKYLDKYGYHYWKDFGDGYFSSGMLNFHCWNIFLKVSNPEQLKVAEKWLGKLVGSYPSSAMFIDTYANILYKLGDKISAIKWEEKALALAKSRQSGDVVKYQVVIAKMKRGEPTWPIK